MEMNRSGDPDRMVNLSKTLSYILRHGAIKEGLKMRSDGYALVSDVLALPRMKKAKCTPADITEIVEKNAKKKDTLSKQKQMVKFTSKQIKDILLRLMI